MYLYLHTVNSPLAPIDLLHLCSHPELVNTAVVLGEICMYVWVELAMVQCLGNFKTLSAANMENQLYKL